MPETASVKVPGGKLVRVEASYDEVITDVTITGDFFLEPPSALAELEAAIIGLPVDAPKSAFVAEINKVDAQLIGFDADALATAVTEVVDR